MNTPQDHDVSEGQRKVLRALHQRLLRTRTPGDAARDEAILSAVNRQFLQVSELERLTRRQDHDYKTVLETVRLLNQNSLDIPRFEQFTLNTIRGQFAVMKVILLRQGDYMDEMLAVHTPRMLDKPDVVLSMSQPFCQYLTEHSELRDLTDPEVRDDPDARRLRSLGFITVLPLVNGDRPDERTLKGLLALGPRIGDRPFSDEDRELLTLLGSMIGISLHNAHLYHRSIIDFLTQAYSRGHFDINLEQEILRTKRHNAILRPDEPGGQRAVTLVMLDIDDFKKFNDRYGHQVGDKVLFEVSQALKGTVRNIDIVCRYGGEEFGVILPEANAQMAVPIAERIRQAVESRTVLTVDHGPLSVTISVGVATYPNDAQDVRSLVAKADAALYLAKDRGKNRVASARELPPAEHHGD